MGTFVWFIIIFLDICSDVLAFVFDGIRVKINIWDCNMEDIRVKISSDLFGSDFGIIKLKKWLNSKFRK